VTCYFSHSLNKIRNRELETKHNSFLSSRGKFISIDYNLSLADRFVLKPKEWTCYMFPYKMKHYLQNVILSLGYVRSLLYFFINSLALVYSTNKLLM
jgi:hypothetical protein